MLKCWRESEWEKCWKIKHVIFWTLQYLNIIVKEKFFSKEKCLSLLYLWSFWIFLELRKINIMHITFIFGIQWWFWSLCWIYFNFFVYLILFSSIIIMVAEIKLFGNPQIRVLASALFWFGVTPGSSWRLLLALFLGVAVFWRSCSARHWPWVSCI